MVSVYEPFKFDLMLKGDNPGKLDRRITLQQRTVAANAYNEPIETWTILATVSAAIEYPITGSDEETADKLNIARRRAIFTIRYLDSVDLVSRILYGTEVYDIERIAEVGRKQYLKLTAETRE